MGIKAYLQMARDYLKYREIHEKEGNISRVVIDNFNLIHYYDQRVVKKLTVKSINSKGVK